ncbi:hypothetical protein [Acetobacter persici]|uniref:Uncharacterized protein n=1 Tax=Acetobacter persici TaxID=1076596 RepID=A0A6V8I885_9PROT|nr:hypothetical protein [Acetobacter persici]OUI89929.1 hypothetical protein HK19_13460 [Acetobacter persici]GFE93524.1 hypothetical protein DmAi_15830 [Acetobacter persici]
MNARKLEREICTAWVSRDGRIEWRPGVGFPDATLPLCCGTRDAIRASLRGRAWNGKFYAVPGMTDLMPDQQAYEAIEHLRINMMGESADLISYYRGTNRRDLKR